MPWYFNFFRTWQDCETKLLLSYEEMMADKAATLRRIADFSGLEITDADITSALGDIPASSTRKNVGISGRGEILSDEVKAKITHYGSYYSNLDLSVIGL